MDRPTTQNLPPDSTGIAEAVAILRRGGLVALPTETVYGLAADARCDRAVAGIFAAKDRPRFNPLIVHLADMDAARALAEFTPAADALAAAFWPGPLTLVLPLKAGSPIHPLVSAGLDTVALRMPGGFAHDLIAAFGKPLAAPSANTSGRITATSAQAVDADLGGRLDLIVDGGATPVGLESTIVKVEADGVRVLRPGGIAAEDIEKAGVKLLRGAAKGIEAPGMLASHYAPGAAVRPNAVELREGEALLAFGPMRIAGSEKAVAVLNLSETGDLHEAAARLFAHLAELDRSGAATIAVEPVPHEGLGEAINDRLARAAAPRGGIEGRG